jgi:hypothetical protein
MKRTTILGIIGWSLLGLAVLSFVLRALWQVQSGQDVGYYNYKKQPMTYLGALASLALVVLVGLVGLYYRVKKVIEKRRDGPTSESTVE